MRWPLITFFQCRIIFISNSKFNNVDDNAIFGAKSVFIFDFCKTLITKENFQMIFHCTCDLH